MTERSAKKIVIQYPIEQIYLEIARSIASVSLFKLYKSPKEPDDLSKENQIRFAAAAVTIAFSYAAIEAFTNLHLHELFERHRALLIKNPACGGLFKANKKLEGIFSDGKSFEFFCRSELKEKLKVLCEGLGVPQLCSGDKRARRLWNDILAVCEDMRDFIIHPDPRPTVFSDQMKRIMGKHKLGAYSTIAGEFIAHICIAKRWKIPAWTKENTTFRFLNSRDLEEWHKKGAEGRPK